MVEGTPRRDGVLECIKGSPHVFALKGLEEEKG